MWIFLCNLPYCYLHFTDKETGLQKLSYLAESTFHVNGIFGAEAHVLLTLETASVEDVASEHHMESTNCHPLPAESCCAQLLRSTDQICCLDE